ncbi:hypothetical protein [uncultured Campylobacter sp.]|uniref:hypothetical protein n=1 Tax=uncultured Campylobacter sp. TaxID=218934 RepID=UPI002625929C|nr:hypothetical protein [uncultured Campylobacter sp.]
MSCHVKPRRRVCMVRTTFTLRRSAPHCTALQNRAHATPRPTSNRTAPRGILRNIKTDYVDLNLCGDEIL